MRRICCRSTRPRSDRYSSCYEVSKDVRKAIRARSRMIVQLANSYEVPLRLILGVDAEKRVHQAEAARASEAENWRPARVKHFETPSIEIY